MFRLKSLIFALILIWGSSSVAANEHVQQKLIYCDHTHGNQIIYLDIYLTYYPSEALFANPQVGVYDPTDPIGYPSYLWPLSLIFDPSHMESVLVIDRGIGNEMHFTLPAMDSGILLPTVSGEIIPFNLNVDGFYKGQQISTLLSCYGVYIPQYY